ncbi:MAG: hypothetical protein M0Z49_00220 [Chloroflexi bacterium]|nr:hypothetical protein [Chloroflexota bacterium]
MHLAIGSGFGVLFALAEEPLRPPGPVPAHAIAYASRTWAASCAALGPSLGLIPAPWDAPRDRAPVMLAAHLVYGAIPGGLFAARRLTR